MKRSEKKNLHIISSIKSRSGGDFSNAMAPNMGEVLQDLGNGVAAPVSQPQGKSKARAKAKPKAKGAAAPNENGGDGNDPAEITPTTPLQQAKALAKSVLLISVGG